jgi:hypothetical protein
MDWIIQNKEWLFSGIAVAIPIAIIGWLLKSRSSKKLIQKSGDDSNNIQIGGSININSKHKHD